MLLHLLERHTRYFLDAENTPRLKKLLAPFGDTTNCWDFHMFVGWFSPFQRCLESVRAFPLSLLFVCRY